MGHVVIIVGSHHNAPRIIYTHNHRHTQGSKYDDTCVREGMFVFSRLAGWLAGWPHRHLQTCTVSVCGGGGGGGRQRGGRMNARARQFSTAHTRTRVVVERDTTMGAPCEHAYGAAVGRRLFSYTSALSIVNNVSLIGVMRWRYGGGCER